MIWEVGVNHFSISRLNLNFKILGEILVSDRGSKILKLRFSLEIER